MAWAVLGVYSAFKAASFAFVDPELMRERAAPGPGVDRVDAAVATLGYLGLYPGTFVAAGATSVQGNPFFYRQATFSPSQEIEKSGTFECGEAPGAGTYGVRVVTTSRVAVEGGEDLATQFTVVLDGEVDCV